MPYGNLSPIDFLAGAKLALEQAGLFPWVTVALIVIIAMTVLSGSVD